MEKYQFCTLGQNSKKAIFKALDILLKQDAEIILLT
jgi:hypothetical protein